MRGLPAAAILVVLVAAPVSGQAPGRSNGFISTPELHYRNVRDSEVVRGVWVTRWEYRSPESVTALVSRAAALGLTDIFFQVRGRADAFYRSILEPWGEELTGRLGADPGWDPLEVAVREAHSRGLRLHAWINTFPMWSGNRPPPVTYPRHIYLSHPDWIMANRYGETQRLGNRFIYVSASPGNREVQDHIQAVVMDIVDRYAVDGVHFDYIRLPDQDYSYDATSRGRYLAGNRHENYMEWQADQITGMLERIAASARQRRPELILTAAIVNHYHRAVGIFAQDPVAWTSSGALDYVIPMAYTPSAAEFAGMVEGYLDMIPGEKLAMGINLGEMPGRPTTAAVQVRRSLTSGTRGHVFFSLSELNRLAGPTGSRGDLYGYLEDLYGERFEVAERRVPVRVDLIGVLAKLTPLVVLLLP
jgi:uncharacterized lipoprotein YddW (UPF0748 family)